MEKRNGNIDSNILEIKVTKIICNFGIPANVKGYRYIRSAIIMAINEPEVLEGITKDLYPSLAREYKTMPSRIERGIRNAIRIAWNRGETEARIELFGKKQKEKVTNSLFISTIAEKIKIELMQDNE